MESHGDGRKGRGSFGVGDGGGGDERSRYEGRTYGDDGRWHETTGRGESDSRWCLQDRSLYGRGRGRGRWHCENDRVGHQWQAGGVLTSNSDLQRRAQEWRGDGFLHRETRGQGHFHNHYSKAIHSHRGRAVGQKRLPGGNVPDRWLDFQRMVGIILLPTFSEGGVTKSSISSLTGQSEEYESGKRKGNEEEGVFVKKLFRSLNCSSIFSASVSRTSLTSVSSASASLVSPCSSALAEDSSTSSTSVSHTSLTSVSSASASLVSPCSSALAEDSSTSSTSVSRTSLTSVSSASASLVSPCSSALAEDSSTSSASVCRYVSKGSEGGDSWLPFVPMGCRLGGILPCKTFLDVCFDNRLSEDELWHPTNLRQQIEGHLSLLGEDQKGVMSLDYFRKHQPIVAVINLCLTERHYDRDDLRSQGIEHYWLKVDGGGEVPSDRVLSRFFRLMQYLGSRHPGKIVAVHCTHGVNRTGYFLVTFLMICYGLPFDIAYQWFQKSRGHPMNREELISCLEQLPNRVRKNDHNVAKLFELALVPPPLQRRYDTEEKRLGNCGYMASSFFPEVNPLLAVNGSAACDCEGSEENGVFSSIHESVSDTKVSREDLKETTESSSQQRCGNCRVLFGPLSDELISPEDLYVSLLYHNSVVYDIGCLKTCDTTQFPELAVASQEKISVQLNASTNDTLTSIAPSRLRHHWIAEVVVQDDASVNILMKAGSVYLKGAQVTARAPQEFLNIFAEALVADQKFVAPDRVFSRVEFWPIRTDVKKF